MHTKAETHMPTKKSLHSVEAVFDDFYAIRAPQAAFPDVMFPGIAARCLSHGNVLRPAFLVLCFPVSVKLSCSNVLRDRGEAHW